MPKFGIYDGYIKRMISRMISNMIPWIACFNIALLFSWWLLHCTSTKTNGANRKNKTKTAEAHHFFLAPLKQVGLPGRVCCINSQLKTLDILDTSHWSNQASITEAHNRSTLESESPPKGFGCWWTGRPGCWFPVVYLYMCCNNMLLAFPVCLRTVSI